MSTPEEKVPPAAEGDSTGPRKKKKARKKKSKASGLGATKNKGDAELTEAKKWLDSLKVEDIISKSFFSEDFLAKSKESFSAETPFPHLHVKKFMDDAFLRRLGEELQSGVLDFFQKRNDLYEFHQSDDLKNATSPLVAKLKEILYSEQFRGALSAITGLQFKGLEDSAPSISCAVYQDTHRLLCHDDELAGRRIAYILYLVPEDWKEQDGGSLDLFNVDSDGEPNKIVKSLVPEWNSFAFFEVSPVSYHQVAEVLCEKNRISISGWFHGEPIERPPRSLDPLPTFTKVFEPAETSLEDWVARDYRKKGIIKKVNSRFAEESSIELQNYLRKDVYDKMIAAFQSEEWVQKGPANKRNYGIIKDQENQSEGGALLRSFSKFMQSKAFVDHLVEITGLELTEVAGELRRLSHRDYTLNNDHDPENDLPGLDVVLFFMGGNVRWNPAYGATLHYLVAGEDEELLTVDPAPNTLALVYRAGGGTLRFTNYVNHHSPAPIYQLFSVFRVLEEDDDDEGDEGDSEDDVEMKQ